jgi:hypothetical protein
MSDENDQDRNDGVVIPISRKRRKNSPGLDWKGQEDWLITFILVSVGGIYGGFHALTCNAPFRTEVEQLLWQISVSTVMCYGLFYVHTLNMFKKFARVQDESYKRA